MKVFVTGATGFVGHPVARELAAQGAELRLLIRKASNLANRDGISTKAPSAKPSHFTLMSS